MRQERVEDRQQVHDLLVEAFGQKDEAELVENLRKCEEFVPELSIVGVEDDKVIGHILFTPLKVEGEKGTFDALALAPLAVHPNHQKVGIGSSLVEHGLEECRRLGHRMVVVLGDPNYYRRFGFRTARKRGIDTKIKVADQYFMVLALVEGALDGVGGVVRYLPPFSEL